MMRPSPGRLPLRRVAPSLALSLALAGAPAPGAAIGTESLEARRWQGTGWEQEPDSGLLVLAAASLTDVLPRVGELWRRRGGVALEFSFDATSRLAPQTLEGANADLFFSADEQWMDWVSERRGILQGTRVDLLGNQLVLVVPAEDTVPPREPGDLTGPSVRRLALAGENVPAGRYARAALESAGVWNAIAPRVVRAGTVRGALEWVALGEVDAGVVYRTDALAEPRVRMAFEFSPEGHPPITYPAAVLSSSHDPESARAFLAFCQTDVAGNVFREEGFDALTEAPAGVGFGEEREPVGGARSETVPPAPLPNPWSAIRLSFLVALAATVVGFIPAVWLGWVLARKDFIGKSVLATIILVPLVLPPVVTGFLLLSLLGSRSLVGSWLASMGVPIPFTLLGAILAAFAVGLPLYVVSIRNAFQVVDPAYEEISWTLGHRPLPTFLRVTFPLAVPGIAAGAVLAFARALGEFGATVVLAGNVEGRTRTIALAVYTLLESPEGRHAIWTLVGASILLSLLALLGYEILSRRQRRQMELRRGR